jgi:hypothetical protein
VHGPSAKQAKSTDLVIVHVGRATFACHIHGRHRTGRERSREDLQADDDAPPEKPRVPVRSYPPAGARGRTGELIGDLLDELAGLQVDDVEAVARQIGDKEAISLGVEGKMVQPPRRSFQRDRLNQL